MKKQFVTLCEDFPRSITRKNAHGIKNVVIAEDVNMPCCINMEYDENGTLHITDSGEELGEEEEACYTILCKEFGLVGESKKFYSDISVIFLDGGWMLVTLKKGAIAVTMDGEMVLPAVGDISGLGAISESSAVYLDAQTLMEYIKYSKDKAKFPWEFEFAFAVSGGMVNTVRTIRVRIDNENTVDLSMGYYALYLQREQAKQNTKIAKNFMSQFTNSSASTESEWEDDDEVVEDDDEDDEDEWE